MKQKISLILILCLCFSLLSVPANAADTPDEALGEVNIISGGYPMSYLAVNGKVQKQEYTYFLHNDPITGKYEEIPAYCVNPDQFGVPQTVGEGESIKYLAEEAASDPKIVGLVANMYPHRGLAELKLDNIHQAFYAGKIALWCYLIPSWDISKVTVNPALTGLERDRGERIRDAAIDIYNKGMSWSSVPQPRLTTTPDREYAYPVTIDGKEYKQQIFTVTSDTWVCNYDVKVSFATADDVPAGTRITDPNNKDITVVKVTPNGGEYSGKFKVLYPIESVADTEGSVEFSLTAEVYKYVVFYALCQETDQYGNLQKYLADTDPQTTLMRSGISKFDKPGDIIIPPDTGLEILKLEEGTDLPLAGAAFEVKNPDGAVIGTYTTGYDGKITIPLTIVGNYTITEVTPPKGYLLAKNNVQSVTVKYGEVAKVSFHNAPYGELRIEKIDGVTGAGLEGALLQYKNIKTGAVQTVTTRAAGVAQISELAPGSYEVKELSAPIGFIRDDTVQTVEVVAGQTSTVTFKNLSKPGLRITKFDAATGATLPGVTFELYRDAALIGQYVTDAMGEIVLRGIEPGTYLVKEIATDSGHVVNSTPQQIEIKAGATSLVELIFFNELKPGISLVKVDANTMRPLANAKFLIKKVGDTFAKEYTSGADGKIDLAELTPGAYTVREITAPDGYLIDDGIRIIQINAGENAQFVFTNTPKPTLSLLKLSSDGTPLAGATFKIGRIGDDGTAYSSYVTDTQGRIFLDKLEPGTFSVIEVTAPSGYVLDPIERHVELFPGKAAELVIENKAKPNLKIVKTDAITGAPVAGVTFTVKKVDSSTLTTVTTDANGEALIERLDPGVYEVTEQSVPSGYLLDTTPQLITLVPNKTATVQFQNYPRPSLEIIKTSTKGEAIPGAVFTLKTKTGTLIGDFTTDAEGKIQVYNLDDGYYIITEKSVPAPFILDTTPHEILMVEGKITSTTIENKRLPDLTVSKVDSITGDPLQGAKFTVWYAADSLSGDLRKIGDYITGENGKFELKSVNPGWYRVTETEPPAGYALKDPSTLDVFMEADVDKTLTFENTPLNSLIIKKVDATDGHVLQGAKFRVRYFEGVTGTGGTTIGEYTTSAQGTIVITGLKAGTYVIEETHAPEGYITDDAPKTVYLSGEAQAAVTVEFSNQPNSGLTITKLDSVTKEPLAGAVFEIRNSAGGVVGNENGQYISNESGTIHIPGLPTDTYVIKEIKAPDGYALNGDAQTVKLIHGETHSLTFYNTPNGGLTITKLDSVTKKPLAGAIFEVRNSAGGVVGNANGQYTTDVSGTIQLPGLPADTYVIKEIKAPDGYALSGEPQTVKLAQGETHSLTFYNTPNGGLTITKLDSVTKKPLAGAIFEIRDSAGGVVGNSNGQYTTDESGTIQLPGLPADTYVVKEMKAPDGYVLTGDAQTVKLTQGETHSLTFYNAPKGSLVITKQDSETKLPLAGAVFKITTSSGAFVAAQGGAVSSNGLYTTDKNGQIILTGLEPDTYVVTETKAPAGFVLDATPQTVVVNAHDTQTLTFYNEKIPEGGLRIVKLDEETRQPIRGVEFEVTHMDGARIGTYRTDSKGIIHLPKLTPGWYTITERKAADGYTLDAQPRDVEVKDSTTATVEVTNRQQSNIVIRKVDAATGEGLYGAVFVLYDGRENPVGEYRSDQRGYVYIDSIPDGKYQIREIEAPEGYTLDNEYKTIHVRYGGSSEIRWENTAVKGQIQIVKKSADYSSTNGLPAGTLLAGATFEIYNERTGNKVDTIVTGANGLAVSKQLPLGRYTIREVKAPANYAVSGADITAVLEFSGQIVRFEVLNQSASTGVSITKTGPKEAVGNQPVRYVFSGIANTGSVALDSFYWKDTLPAQAILNKVVTGSYNRPGNYKIVYRVNGGDYLTLADNLSTNKVYTLDASPAALDLAVNERVTEIMFAFGQAPAGFAQVEAPMLYCTTAPGLVGGITFANTADVGGVYNGQWIQAVSRWVTTVYGKPTPLPRTGY